MNKIYAGIGSRETPQEVLTQIRMIATGFSKLGWTLRSGGADGADSAFEAAASVFEAAAGKKEIYLPWKGFNQNPSPLYDITEEALEFAERFHPRWDGLTQAAKKLMARNCYQVLGKTLDNPVDLVVCWTKDGQASGGTGQAMRIAKAHDIPIYNLKNDDDFKSVIRLILYMRPNANSVNQ